jgi:hypothetical protein
MVVGCCVIIKRALQAEVAIVAEYFSSDIVNFIGDRVEIKAALYVTIGIGCRRTV